MVLAELGGCIIGSSGYNVVKELIFGWMMHSISILQSNSVNGQVLAYFIIYALVHIIDEEEIDSVVKHLRTFCLEIMHCAEQLPSPALSFPLAFFSLARRIPKFKSCLDEE